MKAGGSLQLKKLLVLNKPTIYLSNANLALGQKEVRRSTGHIMVTTRNADKQRSKSRQNFMRLYKQWHHHGDNPLRRPTEIQIATKSYATLQAMAPTNVKTVHQTSLLHIESNLDRLGLSSPTHDQRSQQQSGQNTLQSILIPMSKFLKATHRTEIRKIEIRRSMVVEAELVKPAREPASSRSKPCASLPVRRFL